MAPIYGSGYAGAPTMVNAPYVQAHMMPASYANMPQLHPSRVVTGYRPANCILDIYQPTSTAGIRPSGCILDICKQ